VALGGDNKSASSPNPYHEISRDEDERRDSKGPPTNVLI
jgi:hypothetical protein